MNYYISTHRMCHIHRESFKSLKRSVAFDDHLCMIVDAYLIANTDVHLYGTTHLSGLSPYYLQ